MAVSRRVATERNSTGRDETRRDETRRDENFQVTKDRLNNSQTVKCTEYITRLSAGTTKVPKTSSPSDENSELA